MNDIKSYIILNRKTSYVINFFLLISFIILIALIMISQFKYQKYYETTAQVIKDNNQYQLTLFINPYKINVLKNNNKIIIDDYETFYKIEYISNEYFINNNNYYLQIKLKVNLKDKDKIVNNILQVKFLESNKKIIYYLKDYLKKGEK